MGIVDQLYFRNEKRSIPEYSRTRDPVSMIGAVRKVNMESRKAIVAEFKHSFDFRFDLGRDEMPIDYFERIQSELIAGFSVLTQPDFFLGDFADLSGVQSLNVPILAKDFVGTRHMIEGCFNAGADVILLISDFLNPPEIRELADNALELGMEVLIEFHDPGRFPEIAETDGVILAYNRRNLRTMKIEEEIKAVNLLLSYEGIKFIESGIGKADFARLNKLDCNAFLIGQSMLEGELLPGVA
ncbi:MAG: hypothetical protein M1267_01730 [Candidatus Thermoplasmatota archaeon]|nr:hypothetical protein [Candidatus Thermoplasmatota archaeon]